MDNFAIDGLGGLSNDPRPQRGDQTRRAESPRKKAGSDSFSFVAGEYLQAIDAEKDRLLEGSFVRSERVEAARRDLEDGSLTSRESIEGAAEQLLRGDDDLGLDADF